MHAVCILNFVYPSNNLLAVSTYFFKSSKGIAMLQIRKSLYQTQCFAFK